MRTRMTSITMVLLVVALGTHPVPLTQVAQATSPEPVELLQFTAGGHVLGFQPDGAYVVGGDHMLRVTFVGARSVAPVSDQLPSGNEQAQPLDKVTYPHLWDGVSLTYEGATGGIAKSSYLLEPGTDVGQIRLRYNVPVQVDDGGSLLFEFDTGRMRETAPVAWQDINGQRIPVQVAFHLVSAPIPNPVVGFVLGEYNPAYPLMIDPTLQWNTFLGSSGTDIGYDIAVDGSGNVYVTGNSYATWGSPVNSHAGSHEAFAAKLDSSGALLWNTFMGSSTYDSGGGIAVDGSGNVYVVGYSDATWGLPANDYEGDNDAFAAKLNSSGARQWNTFLGSSSDDSSSGIAVDGSGNVYVAGYSDATWGLPVNAHEGGYDAFAAQLNSSGARGWNTFLGSSESDDYGFDIAVDGSDNVYVAGGSGATWGSPVNDYEGGVDVFAAKLNSSGARQWNTFLGSSESDDYGYAIAVDGSGNVYVAGYSGATWGPPVNAHAEDNDAFAAKLNSSGARQWNTFLGSSSHDYGNGIAVDGSGNVYVAGYSGATWGPPVNAYAGGDDAFAAKLNSSGVRQWHTFMGSSGTDIGYGIAVDGSDNVYVAGGSAATWGSPVNPHAGGYDAFAAMIGSEGTGPGGVGTIDGTSLELWLKADDGTGQTTDGSAVSTWQDKSGNSHDVTQGTAGNQPTYQTNQLNGNPVVRFDGSSDYMDGGDVLDFQGNTGLTILAVVEPTDDSTYKSIIARDASDNRGWDATMTGGEVLAFDVSTSSTGRVRRVGGNSVSGANVVGYLFEGSTTESVFLNGSNDDDSIDGSVPSQIGGSGPDLWVGSNGYNERFNGDVAEIIVYSSAVITVERTLVENYLAAKYGLTISNDKYTGNDAAYVYDVAGIGQESDGSNNKAHSGGLIVSASSGFLQDDGDYMMFGHNNANGTTGNDCPSGVTSRWSRVWYFGKTDQSSNGGNVDITFDFSELGIGGTPSGDYTLLKRNGTSGDFSGIATSSSISGYQVIFSDVDSTALGSYFTLGEGTPTAVTLTTFAARAAGGNGFVLPLALAAVAIASGLAALSAGLVLRWKRR